MISTDVRNNAGIREFLEYYLLVLLGEGPAPKGEIIETIEQRSADNQKYRPGGVLRIAGSDLDEAIKRSIERNLVKTGAQGGRFTLTRAGRKTLDKMNSQKEQVKSAKEDAIARLTSILVSDAGDKASEKYALDVGTGEGSLAFRLAGVGFRVLGIDSSEFDYSKDSIKKATESGRGKPDVDFQTMDVKDLEMEGAFDYVVSNQAVHCMQDQRGCISAVFRLMKKGGMLVVSDFRIGLKGFFAHGFHSFLALSEEAWKDMLPACGYADVRIHRVRDFYVVEARKPGGRDLA